MNTTVTNATEYRNLPLALLTESKTNPRRTFEDDSLKELAEKRVVTLDDERKAAMVSNLMVVLCSESEVHPIVNTGTLYT